MKLLKWLRAHLQPNRVAVYLAAGAGLAAAVAVPVADLDTKSVVGVLGGLAAIVGAVDRWLKGWQEYERRQADPYFNPPGQAPHLPLPEDRT